MSMDISSFKAKLQGGGARPNLFRVTCGYPAGIGNGTNTLSFLCRAASLPGSNFGMIEVPYMGRKMKIPGDRTFNEWQITVINDNDFDIRDKFETWSNAINANAGNISQNNGLIMIDGQVHQLDRSGKTIKSYTFTDMWPSEIAPIELAHDTNDTIEEFTVTLQYAYWRSNTTD